jgi:PAS domain S-box-containing protein
MCHATEVGPSDGSADDRSDGTGGRSGPDQPSAETAARRLLDELVAAATEAGPTASTSTAAWMDRAAARRAGTPLAELDVDGSPDDRGLFAVLLQHSFDGVVLTGIESRQILEVSESFCRLVGFERDDLIGRTSEEVGYVKPNPERAEAIADAQSGQEGLYETELVNRDGTSRWVEFSHQLLGSELVISIVRDVTARRELEQRLRRQHEAAESARVEAEAARADAERAWLEADRANLAKSEFLSRTSHELRTPLNAVLGFAQLLSLGTLSSGQRESVDQVVKAGRHLLNLINEVLDIARIESGELGLSSEAVLVRDLVREAVDLIRPAADQHEVSIEIEDTRADAYVFADQHRLRQILLNLLSNAVKYNHPGGSVVVSTEATAETTMRIKVADTGSGIRAEDLPMLFVPFQRLGAEQTAVEGTGIGLSLSQRLADAMGGSLGLTSEWGVGSTFWVDLPVGEGPIERLERLHGEPTAPEPVVTAPEPAGVRHKIVQIDDNTANLRLVQRIFDDRDEVEIIPAMHGRLGIELTREHQPSAVLLDLHLPDIGGEQILQQLHEDPETAAIPVVIVSADATPHQIERLLSAGAVAYLTKPFELTELIDTIDRLIEDDSLSS